MAFLGWGRAVPNIRSNFRTSIQASALLKNPKHPTAHINPSSDSNAEIV